MKQRIRLLITWFDNLRLTQKLGWMSLLFILPLAVLLFLLVSETRPRIENYGYQEKYGAEYLRVTRHLMQDVQAHQILTARSLSGTTPDLTSQIAQQRATVAQDFANLDQVNRQYGEAFKSSEAVALLQRDCHLVVNPTEPLSLNSSNELHTRVLSDLKALITLVGNKSYLVLDPDLDSYYMMDTVLLKLPDVQDRLGQIVVASQSTLDIQNLSATERAQLIDQIALLQAHRSASQTNVQAALDNNPEQNLAAIVTAPFQTYLSTLGQFLSVAEQNLTASNAHSSTEFAEAAQSALEQSYQFYDAASQGLEVTIQNRIDQATIRLVGSIAGSLIGILLALLLGLYMMRRVASSLTGLATTSQRWAGGDLSVRASTTGGPEVALVGTAFNEMAQRLAATLQSLEARTEQLRASAEVGRAAVSILDTNQLLREIVNLITDRFGFYYTAVFLADSTNKWAVLREATGEAGRILKERKHQLEIGGQSMVGAVMKTRKARIALDVGDEAVRFANPLLPDTRSEITLPLVVGTRAIGALDVQSKQVAAFDEASAAVLQSMADQIAIALSNTLQFQQSQATLQRTRQLYEASTAISNTEDAVGVLNQLMAATAMDADAAQVLTCGPRDEAGQYAYFELAAHWTKETDKATLSLGIHMPPEQVLPLLPSASEPYIVRDVSDPAVPLEQQQIIQAMNMRAALSYALVAGSQLIGLLLIVYREPHMFVPAETQPLQALTGQIAVTIRNQQLVREQTLARQQLDEINRRLTGQKWGQYVHNRGEAVRKIDVGVGLSQATAAHLASKLAAPVLVHGQEIGVLRLEDATPDREWTPNEQALIQAVAGEVAVAIENARLIEQTERRAQREARLNQITQQLRQATDIQTILQTATEQLSLALDTSHAQARLGAPQGVRAQRNGEHESTPEDTI